MNRSKPTTAFFLLVLGLLTAVGAQARDYHYFKDNIEVDVISDDRGYIRQYPTASKGKKTERSYIAAREGERYRIRIKNHTGERIGVVIAVDGRNIISGSKSYLRNNERMYVVAPWESGEYEGWRTGRDRVNRFYFTDPGDSYADAWGDHSAMGVIAVAVYPGLRSQGYSKKRPNYKALPEARSSRKYDGAGTGFGEDTWSPSHVVKFTPSKHPVYKKFIKYEWRSTLCRRGIIECHPKKRNRFWPDDHDYAPPPWWLHNQRDRY